MATQKKNTSEKKYDCIVIGGGSGGLTVARSLARVGKRVAIVEKHILGGDCTNYGCVPSKALLSNVRKNPRTGLQKALQHMRTIRHEMREEEDVHALEKEGITTILGTGTVVRSGVVRVTPLDGSLAHDVSAKKIVLATGSIPLRIEVPGVPKEKVITNEELFELADNPKNICILGGGYIGCEMAEALQRAGVQVTVIQREDRLVPREEPESSAAVLTFLRGLGVDVQLVSSLEKLAETTLLDSFDYILLALGRTPRVPMGLHEAGVDVKRGVVVNAYNETTLRGVYAVGDCVDGNPTFTHWANNEARGVVRTILLSLYHIPWRVSTRKEVLPTVLYTEVEVARVGKTEAELRREYGDDIRSVLIPFTVNDRAKTELDTAGFVKLFFTPLFGTILGGSIVGKNAGEIVPRLVASVRYGERARSLSAEIYAYPTRADVLKRAADSFQIVTLTHVRSELWRMCVRYGLQVCGLVIWAAAVVTARMYMHAHDMSLLDLLRMLYEFVTTTWYGPVAYMLVYAFRALFFFPATLLTALSGLVFGPVYGLLYTWVGENASAQVSYGVGRFFASDHGTHMHDVFGLRERITASPFMGTLMARLLFIPFDLFNYAAGFLRFPWRGYTLATLVGIIPGMSVFVLAGSSLDPAEFFRTGAVQVNVTLLVVSVFVFLVTLIVARVVKK